jgi:methionine synthase II (cobalamin-independent)
MQIDLNTTIEEIVNKSSEAVKYLMDKKIRCIRCGEPIWGTLGDVLKEKGFSEDEIKQILEDLSSIVG